MTESFKLEEMGMRELVKEKGSLWDIGGNQVMAVQGEFLENAELELMGFAEDFVFPLIFVRSDVPIMPSLGSKTKDIENVTDYRIIKTSTSRMSPSATLFCVSVNSIK